MTTADQTVFVSGAVAVQLGGLATIVDGVLTAARDLATASRAMGHNRGYLDATHSLHLGEAIGLLYRAHDALLAARP